MLRPSRKGKQAAARGLVMVCGALAVLAVADHDRAFGQAMQQLDPLAKSYTLGRFRYEGPDADGWRQIANATGGLQLMYAEQAEDNKINTRCHVIMEIYDLPPEAGAPSAADLTESGRRQQREKLKDQLAGISPIEAVPGTENTYTYRFLLHGPPELGADFYQVYYVVLSPDKTQYVVMQVNTADMDYENQMYFQQFYATLTKLKYQGPAAPPAAAKDAPAAAKDVPSAGAAAPGAAPAPAAPAPSHGSDATEPK